MNKKRRDYSKIFEPKKKDTESITVQELSELSFEEMMLRANGNTDSPSEKEFETI